MNLDRDTIILVINIIITLISGIGAFNSIRYFKKSKHITIYAQTNQALNEVGEMLSLLPEALDAATTTKKGFNSENAVKDIGKKLAGHLNSIMSTIPAEQSAEFRQLQRSYNFELSNYINSLIDGTAIIIDNDRQTLRRVPFDTCQERLRAMQEFLKKKISEEEGKLS